ncbi:MAG: PHP domain-containing protein [Planctomycetes bacterium]|nr:PHP domain-containing protein [Planctomycetota bacterium]
MELDLHIHSKHSFDSRMEPARIVEIARKRGLDGIAVTDHNSIKGSLEAMQFAGKDLLIIPGAEIASTAGDILAYFIHDQPPETKDPFEIVQWIKEHNGMVVMAHPFAYRLSIDAKLVKLLDGIEGFNSRHTAISIMDTSYNMNTGGDYEIAGFAIANNLAMTGGSDAHTYGEIGNGRTIVPGKTLEDVRIAIQNKDTTVAGRKTSFLSKIKSMITSIIKPK